MRWNVKTGEVDKERKVKAEDEQGARLVSCSLVLVLRMTYVRLKIYKKKYCEGKEEQKYRYWSKSENWIRKTFMLTLILLHAFGNFKLDFH